MAQPKLIQTYLLDGTLEGARIIEVSESSVKALVVPRLQLNQIKNRPEANQPSLYFLLSSGENQIYIGESENFYHRIKTHDQSKKFWDIAVAILSTSNNLEKSDVKYLESVMVEKAKASSASEILNKTIPARNNVHEFKIHSLQRVLEDAGLIIESLGFSVFDTKNDQTETVWYCKSKKSSARGQFRGDNFVILAGSIIDQDYTPSLKRDYPHSIAQRQAIFDKFGKNLGDRVELIENVSFKSLNQASTFVTGRWINAWLAWRNSEDKTMDEVIRKDR